MNLKTILFTLGILMVILGLFMLIPLFVQFIYNDQNSTFIYSSLATIIIGSLLILSNSGGSKKLNLQDAFLLTSSSWLSIAIFGSLPFIFSSLDLSISDAFFESMSGITTTGSTIINDLNSTPKSLLFWRGILQWLGGIGIIVMALAVLPLLRVGGMQLFHMESSDQSDKALPRTAQIAAAIVVIYLALTVIWSGALWLAGLSGFDANFGKAE